MPSLCQPARHLRVLASAHLFSLFVPFFPLGTKVRPTDHTLTPKSLEFCPAQKASVCTAIPWARNAPPNLAAWRGPSLPSFGSQCTNHYLRHDFSYLWKSVPFLHLFTHSNFLCVSFLAFSSLQYLICLLFIIHLLHWYAWLCDTLRAEHNGSR